MTPGPTDLQPSDAELIRLTALGNSHAFDSLYDRYSPRLFGLLLRILHSRADAALPVKQRRALLLAYFEGLSQSQIAARLGVPLGTVKTQTRSGLTKLVQLLRNPDSRVR